MHCCQGQSGDERENGMPYVDSVDSVCIAAMLGTVRVCVAWRSGSELSAQTESNAQPAAVRPLLTASSGRYSVRYCLHSPPLSPHCHHRPSHSKATAAPFTSAWSTAAPYRCPTLTGAVNSADSMSDVGEERKEQSVELIPSASLLPSSSRASSASSIPLTEPTQHSGGGLPPSAQTSHGTGYIRFHPTAYDADDATSAQYIQQQPLTSSASTARPLLSSSSPRTHQYGKRMPGSPSQSNLTALPHLAVPAVTRSTSSSPTPLDAEESRIALFLSAASRNDCERLLSLLRKGLSVNVADYDKRTALHVASSDGAGEAVRLLLDEGADINAKDRFGHTALDEAVGYGHLDIAQLLRDHGGQFGQMEKLEAQLIQSAAINDLPQLTALLASGVNANCFDYDRRTPLHLAVAEGHVDAAKLLLQYGARVDSEDRWGSSPLTEVNRRLTRTGQDPMRDVFEAHLQQSDSPAPLYSRFVLFYGVWEVIVICLMGGFARYDQYSDGRSDFSTAALIQNSALHFSNIYPLYQDVHVMIFIGFAYLMVFLRKHGYTSVGVTFLVAAFVIQWYQLTRGFWHDSFQGAYNHVIISIETLVQADFCAGAVLITFGVVLGKVSPSQMMLIAVCETVFYALNEQIGSTLQVADLGGTMTIHMFGAFFGFAVSKMVTPRSALGNQNNAAVYHSDILAMIGTIFLWMFWPSFNAALGVGNSQPRAVINTLLSIAASCVTAFLTSYALRRDARFNMVDVQNATLAGGVAMGACCNLLILPGSAMGIGAAAGVVSVAGFVHVQPWLEEHLGLHDTCGVNNLHGMPSLIGGVASIIAAAVASDYSYSVDDYSSIFGSYRASGRTSGVQAVFQLIYMATSIGIGLGAGLITGVIAKHSFFEPPADDDTDAVFQDDRWWEVPHLELPYFFDRRGEVSRGAGNLGEINMGGVDGKVGGSVLMVGGDMRDKGRVMQAELEAMKAQLAQLTKQLSRRTASSSSPLAASLSSQQAVDNKATVTPISSPPIPSYPPSAYSGYPYPVAHPPYSYYPYPTPYVGHAGYQPTNNHSPIVPPDVAYPYPAYTPTIHHLAAGQPTASGSGSSGVSGSAVSGGDRQLMDAMLALFRQHASGGSGAADASTSDAAHKEL